MQSIAYVTCNQEHIAYFTALTKAINSSVFCTLNIHVQGPSLKYCLFRESEHIETMTTLTDYMTSPQTLGLK